LFGSELVSRSAFRGTLEGPPRCILHRCRLMRTQIARGNSARNGSLSRTQSRQIAVSRQKPLPSITPTRWSLMLQQLRSIGQSQPQSCSFASLLASSSTSITILSPESLFTCSHGVFSRGSFCSTAPTTRTAQQSSSLSLDTRRTRDSRSSGSSSSRPKSSSSTFQGRQL
jgi:hypothetical protein